MPSATPLFITPVEYTIKRVGKADTTVRLVQNNAVETFSFALSGTVTLVQVDKKNWIINNLLGPTKDVSLGVQTTTGDPLETNFSGIKISPNPTSGSFSLLNPTRAEGLAQVYTLNGKLVLDKKLDAKTDFDLGHYPGGIYIIKIYDTNGDEQFVQKIIKQ
jgi:hypothetical protein